MSSPFTESEQADIDAALSLTSESTGLSVEETAVRVLADAVRRLQRWRKTELPPSAKPETLAECWTLIEMMDREVCGAMQDERWLRAEVKALEKTARRLTRELEAAESRCQLAEASERQHVELHAEAMKRLDAIAVLIREPTKTDGRGHPLDLVSTHKIRAILKGTP